MDRRKRIEEKRRRLAELRRRKEEGKTEEVNEISLAAA